MAVVKYDDYQYIELDNKLEHNDYNFSNTVYAHFLNSIKKYSNPDNLIKYSGSAEEGLITIDDFDDYVEHTLYDVVVGNNKPIVTELIREDGNKYKMKRGSVSGDVIVMISPIRGFNIEDIDRGLRVEHKRSGGIIEYTSASNRYLNVKLVNGGVEGEQNAGSINGNMSGDFTLMYNRDNIVMSCWNLSTYYISFISMDFKDVVSSLLLTEGVGLFPREAPFQIATKEEFRSLGGNNVFGYNPQSIPLRSERLSTKGSPLSISPLYTTHGVRAGNLMVVNGDYSNSIEVNKERKFIETKESLFYVINSTVYLLRDYGK